MFFKQKPLKSAQEVAQYCATSCALVDSSRFIYALGMYPHSYPHLSAQLLAQLVFFAGGVLRGFPGVNLSEMSPCREGIHSAKN